VPKQIARAFRFVADRVREGEIPTGEDVNAVPVHQYPMIAVREVIANALVHRDYGASDMCVHVRLYSDRLEVTSPGDWEGRNLADGEEHDIETLVGESRRRNFRLASVLTWSPVFEGEGSGLPSAVEDCNRLGSPHPVMIQRDGFVTVVIRPQRATVTRPDEQTPYESSINSRLLGLVIPDEGNPFYSEVAAAVERAAQAEDYLLIVANSDSRPENEKNILRSLCKRRVAGLLVIATPGANHEFLDSEFHMDKQVVFIEHPAQRLKADFVSSDNVGGAREAVEHLIRHGHKRIGMLVGDPAVWSDNERLRGYKEALAAHGILYDDALVKSNCRDVVTAELAAYQLLLELSSPPTAIFAYNNRSAIGAVRAINKLRPTTALVGFDDFESAEMLSLTVQAQDTFQLGKLATETLLRRLKGKEFDIQNVRIPTWLIERGSGEKAPQVVTDDPSQGGSSGP
jgi:LacI family transcriptional regulator